MGYKVALWHGIWESRGTYIEYIQHGERNAEIPLLCFPAGGAVCVVCVVWLCWQSSSQ